MVTGQKPPPKSPLTISHLGQMPPDNKSPANKPPDNKPPRTNVPITKYLPFWWGGKLS